MKQQWHSCLPNRHSSDPFLLVLLLVKVSIESIAGFPWVCAFLIYAGMGERLDTWQWVQPCYPESGKEHQERRRNVFKATGARLEPRLPDRKLTGSKAPLPYLLKSGHRRQSSLHLHGLLPQYWVSFLVRSLGDIETHTYRWGLQHLGRHGFTYSSSCQT